MTEREKLIKLLWGNYNDHPYAFSGLTDDFEHEAEFLISHGVTVREKGEWEVFKDENGIFRNRCKVCGSPTRKGYKQTNFCPNCGAGMRKEKE